MIDIMLNDRFYAATLCGLSFFIADMTFAILAINESLVR